MWSCRSLLADKGPMRTACTTARVKLKQSGRAKPSQYRSRADRLDLATTGRVQAASTTLLNLTTPAWRGWPNKQASKNNQSTLRDLETTTWETLIRKHKLIKAKIWELARLFTVNRPWGRPTRIQTLLRGEMEARYQQP